ncbi:MAG: DMT family transporter [Acidobacteriota bacterium]
MIWIFLLLAFLAGAVVPLQTGINASMAKWTGGNASFASLVSFSVGTMTMLVYMLVLRVPFPAMNELTKAPLWMWTAGVLGAFFIASTTVAASKMSAALLIGLITAGQLIVALVLDHFGWLGYEAHPINFWRIIGVALLIIGVILLRQF